MTELMNQIRFYFFISGVLNTQQADPLCGKCRAFTNTAQRMKEGFAELESLLAAESISAEMGSLADAARLRLADLKIPEGAEGQKKAGRCKMAEGVCFVKLSKAVREKI